MCKLGESFVSETGSSTGWGYESQVELDGFLITIPETGGIKWDTGKDRFYSVTGELFAIDHREVRLANYGPDVRYVSIFLSYQEVLKYLSLLIGDTPRCRLFITNKKGDKRLAQCFAELVRTIMLVSANCPAGQDRSLRHLKECLISVWLYNIHHNYSQMLSNPGNIRKLAPHSVNLVAAYISANYDKDLTVSQLAVSAGVSIRTLQLSFKSFKNVTPMGYLRRVRLENARSMLLDPNCELTVKQISDRCGFSDYYLFAKHYYSAYVEHPKKT